jgi:hypothetical protein
LITRSRRRRSSALAKKPDARGDSPQETLQVHDDRLFVDPAESGQEQAAAFLQDLRRPVAHQADRADALATGGDEPALRLEVLQNLTGVVGPQPRGLAGEMERVLLDLPPRSRLLFLAGGSIFVFGALGMELVANAYWMNNVRGLTIGIITTIEELFEMGGIVIFVYALLDYLEIHVTRGISITMS